MLSSANVVVTGLAASYPFGGVFFDYIQYALGFQRLGHNVLYLEDTGRWCYDPVAHTFVESGKNNAAYLEQSLRRVAPELSESWFYRDSTGEEFGMPWHDVLSFLGAADLLVHISASCWMREEYFGIPAVAFIDSDPVYTQARIWDYDAEQVDSDAYLHAQWLQRHSKHFTFGLNVGSADCPIPNTPIAWTPTVQPIVMDLFQPHRLPPRRRRKVATTVASWEPTEAGPTVDGRHYKGKSTEFARFMSIGSRSPVPLEVAISGPAPLEQLRSNGWQLRPGNEVSSTPEQYRHYLADSLCEWSVAKNAYVASHSGWFSCRTACYLALGVPAVVQATGFERYIPCGKGLLAFEDVAQSLSALSEVVADPEAHSAAAIEICRETFAHDRVLPRFLEQALSPSRGIE